MEVVSRILLLLDVPENGAGARRVAEELFAAAARFASGESRSDCRPLRHSIGCKSIRQITPLASP
jgi:hypothetical protein